jgi:hypothetical protein
MTAEPGNVSTPTEGEEPDTTSDDGGTAPGWDWPRAGDGFVEGAGLGAIAGAEVGTALGAPGGPVSAGVGAARGGVIGAAIGGLIGAIAKGLTGTRRGRQHDGGAMDRSLSG